MFHSYPILLNSPILQVTSSSPACCSDRPQLRNISSSTKLSIHRMDQKPANWKRYGRYCGTTTESDLSTCMVDLQRCDLFILYGGSHIGKFL